MKLSSQELKKEIVLHRLNRLQKLVEQGAPAIILQNEFQTLGHHLGDFNEEFSSSPRKIPKGKLADLIKEEINNVSKGEV
jgi:DNA-directed RNA polymerase beta' subunit